MKLTSIGSVVASSGFLKEYQFGIRTEDLGMNLNTLRSKMYSDPINAICREISSNSRDANREVKNEKIPVRIEFNDSLFAPGDLSISFSDDGPGISPDRMENIFVNYGASTKRDSNKQTGGFGYGAKTPFSYTDSFQIVTKVDRIKYTYIAAIEETGTGKIYLLNEEPTTENNGTSIIISIKKHDKQKFMLDVIRNTFFWKVKPITNFNYRTIQESDTIQIHNFLVVNNEFKSLFSDHIYLLIDDIPYVLDTQLLKIPYSLSYSVFLPFKTGELTISANRETVQYDDHTINKITKRYHSSVDSIHSQFQTQIDQQKTYFEACLCLQNFYTEDNNIFCDILKDNNKNSYTFNGKQVIPKWRMNSLALFLIEPHRKTQIDKISSMMDIKNQIYLIDAPKMTISRNKTIQKNNTGFFCIEIVHKDLRQFSSLQFKQKRFFSKKMREVLKEVQTLRDEGWPLAFYSSVEKTYEKREYRKRESINAQVYSSSKYKFKYQEISILNIDKSNLVYIVADDIRNDLNKDLIVSWIKFLKALGTIKHEFVVIQTKQLKYFKNKLSLDEFIKTLDKNLMEEMYLHFLVNQNKLKELAFLSHLSFDDGFSKKISIFINRISKSRRIYETVPVNYLTYFPLSTEVQDTMNRIEKIKDEYLILEFIDFDQSGDKFKILVSEINDYIKIRSKKEIV
jgi:Histidine kinase-, DNA gyrase B-, and HSP90-like ATPase